ncbi:hypothetical protein Avbf_09403 [Armadillidium vulgare]|nr:hypothetical protein Avbf_09403 [Armadillidium vulgare]
MFMLTHKKKSKRVAKRVATFVKTTMNLVTQPQNSRNSRNLELCCTISQTISHTQEKHLQQPYIQHLQHNGIIAKKSFKRTQKKSQHAILAITKHQKVVVEEPKLPITKHQKVVVEEPKLPITKHQKGGCGRTKASNHKASKSSSGRTKASNHKASKSGCGRTKASNHKASKSGCGRTKASNHKASKKRVKLPFKKITITDEKVQTPISNKLTIICA